MPRDGDNETAIGWKIKRHSPHKGRIKIVTVTGADDTYYLGVNSEFAMANIVKQRTRNDGFTKIRELAGSKRLLAGAGPALARSLDGLFPMVNGRLKTQAFR
jgi:hypothetical protein